MDTHADLHVAAALDPLGGLLGVREFPATATGYAQLLDWLGGPPSIPITIQYQPFNGTAPVYLDVVGCAHDVPEDEEQWLRLQMEPIELVFLAPAEPT